MKDIKSVFSINIPKIYRQQFIHAFVQRNLKRTLIMAVVIMMLEIIYLIISYIPSFTGLYGDKLSIYRVLYLFIILYTGSHVFVILCFKNSLLKRIKLVEALLHISAIILLTWSGILSVVDMTRGLQGFLYIFIGMAVAVIMIMRPIRSSMVYLLAHIVFITLNFVYDLPREVIFSNIINMTSVIITAFIVSVILFQSASRDFTRQQIITTQRDALELATLTDPLTGLFNRRGLEAKLDAYMEEAASQTLVMSVIMIDIDYFKAYNDTYGHVKGDQALIAVADVIKSTIEDFSGFGCRYGGDEFSMILFDEANEIIESVVAQLKQRTVDLDIENKASQPTQRLRIGVGYHMDTLTRGQDPWVIIDKADQALYDYKRSR